MNADPSLSELAAVAPSICVYCAAAAWACCTFAAFACPRWSRSVAVDESAPWFFGLSAT